MIKQPIMDNDFLSIVARQSLHEYAIEVWMANLLAEIPEADAEGFLRRFAGRPTHSKHPANELTDALLLRYHEIETSFVEKVRERSIEIRERLRGGS